MSYHYGNPHLDEVLSETQGNPHGDYSSILNIVPIQPGKPIVKQPEFIPKGIKQVDPTSKTDPPSIFTSLLANLRKAAVRRTISGLGGIGLMMYPSELGHGMRRPGHIGPLVDGPDWPGLTPEQWDAETKRRYDEAIRDFEAESRRSYPVGGYTDNTGLLLALKKGLNAYRDLFGPTYNWNQPTPGAGGGGGGYTGEEGEENSGYETPGNPHKDKPVDLSDWLNENVPPLKPAPEIPEYEPPLPPREEWARTWEGTDYSDRYPGDFDGYFKPLISGIGATIPDSYTGNPLPDYSRLRSPYPAALNLYAMGKDIYKYVGQPGYENLLGLEFPQVRYPDLSIGGQPMDSWTFKIKQHADLDAQLEEEYQQELIDQQASYDEMVAEMVETERLRQEEYTAERQRYTDMYFDLDNALAYDPYKVSKKELPASITPSMEQMLEWNPFQFDTNFNTNIPNPALTPEERQLDPDAANKALDAMGYGPLS